MILIKNQTIFSILVYSSITAIAIVLEIVFGAIDFDYISYPTNLFLIINLLILQFLIYLFFKKTSLFKWFISPKTTIFSILNFAVYILIMAIIPQTKKACFFLDLNQMVHTWMFAAASFLLIVSLGFVTLRKSFPIKRTNIFFFLNHFGLWIVLTAGLLGAADRKELMMQVYEGQVIWYAQDENRKVTELPLAIKLEQFVMKSYPPKIALVNRMGKPYKVKGAQLAEITKPLQLEIDGIQLLIEKYYPEAITKGNNMENRAGALATNPAAFVKVLTPNKMEFSGWISSGNYTQQPNVIELSKDTLLCLLPPEPAYFGSKVTLYSQSNNQSVSKIISVNNPTSIEGWDIYQYGYDTQLGDDSPYSVFLLVKDPWLPFVYVGIVLLLLGALWMIFSKLKTAKAKEDTL